jgi:tetratricopeptide (TPR) repeat protein
MKVIDALIQESSRAEDPVDAVNALMQQGEIYRDELGDDELATLCFEAVWRHEVGRIPALIALEPLFAKAGAWDKLARVYAEQSEVLATPGARVTALRELARLQESRGVGDLNDQIAAYYAILAIDAGDIAALGALEKIGRDTRNDRILARVYRRLAEITDDQSVCASHLVRLGQALERLDDRGALDAYRRAVRHDPQLLTAIRGVARVGALLGDPRAMAQAARLEAELTRKPEMAAKLFVRAGIIRHDQMNDLGAVEDFERALEVWPDDTEAAHRIIRPLVDTGQIQHLIDVLSKAADSARQAERKTALWLEVGTLYASRLDNLGAGIAAFRRALDATPGHAPALAKLAHAYERNEQWAEAVVCLEQILALTSDDAVRSDAHLRLASIFDEQLNNIERARKNVQAVLRKDATHVDALLRLADIQLRSGAEAEAVETTQKLAALARDPRKKGAALVRVARIQRSRGETAAAGDALGEALALEGPGGEAEEEFKKAIAESGNWVGYAAGLANHILRARQDSLFSGTDLALAYLELATTYADRMALPNKAIETLQEGLEITSSDSRLLRGLAIRLREVGRPEEALHQLKRVLAQEPTRPEIWRELSMVFEALGRHDDAMRAMGPLSVLRADDASAREALSSRPPRPASATEGSFDADATRALAVEMAVHAPAAKLLAAIADAAGKLYPPALEGYGLDRRDRLGPRSNYPTWDLAARIGQIFGGEFALYEHGRKEPMISIELCEPAAIVVSARLRDLPFTQQTFLLSYAMALIAGRTYSVVPLSTAQVELLLVGASRIVSPAFAMRPASAEELDDAKEQLRKSVPRKWRKAMEAAAAEFVARPTADLARWRWAIKQTAARAALLVADDLASTIDAFRYVADVSGRTGVDLILGSHSVRDLVQFWVSDHAATVRRRAGITGS